MKLTKEQVLKNLEDIVRFGGLTMSSEFVESVRIAMEAYENQQGWIPVSEKLPQRGKQVLCCNNHGSVFTSAITYVGKDGRVAFGQHSDVIA